jgi:uncharacterized Ntn-hydrolase superfamily protein
MTYSLLVRCPRTGRLGLGVASHALAIGLYCDAAVRPNVGVTLTQGFPNPRNNRLALDLLAQGFAPKHALAELVADDGAPEYRQIGVVDREGNATAHSGAALGKWAGHRTGENCVALGNRIAGETVLEALVKGYAVDPKADLDERLLTALEAGRDAGGLRGAHGKLPARSVAVTVWHKRDYSEFDLRVDLHDTDAIAELRRVHTDYKPSAAYYEQRARHPQNAIPAMEFADLLKKQQAQEAA